MTHQDLNCKEAAAAIQNIKLNKIYLSADQKKRDNSEQSEQQQQIYLKIVRFIQQDIEFYERILQYEPFELMELLTLLKSNGIKCSKKTLSDFLESQVCFSLFLSFLIFDN
jgi:hypothetical protein